MASAALTIQVGDGAAHRATSLEEKIRPVPVVTETQAMVPDGT
jgi:hypothetical protein